jgi:spermidine synthase
VSGARLEALPSEDPSQRGLSSAAGPAVLALFVVSGAVGLIYEILWTRALGLIFGHTVFAITTVLAAFMLGLSLGSAALGRLARRAGHPLRLYAALEAGIGLSALAVTPLMDAAASLSLRLVTVDARPLAVSAAQFALILPILLLPTALMGGTLPALIRLTGEGAERLGVRAGTLYAANTLGAVGGVATAGFALLPALGNRATGLLAAAANLALAGGAWVLSRSVPAPAPSPPPVSTPLGEDGGIGPHARGAAMLALAASGALAMVSETAWARALSLVVGSSTYAFTAMLLAFLLGIGLGSAAYAARAPRPTLGLLGGIQLGAAGAGALALFAFRRMPDLFLWGFAISDAPAVVQPLQIAVSILTLLPITCALGATFPCAVALAARPGDHASGAVGTPYAVNTLGAIAGTVVAGFLLVPTLGVEGTLRAAVGGSGALALALMAWERWQAHGSRAAGPWRRWGAAGLAAAAALAAAALPGWDRRVLTSGVAIYGNTYLATAGGLHTALAGERLLSYRDGIGATVSVHENARGRFLRINGKTDASTGDMETQLMLGHLPLLLRPGARDVLVIGLGSGVTAGAVLRHPVRHLDVIEIEPAVAEAAAFFSRENGNALGDPRARLWIADARQFLLANSTRYDAIISEPSNPWIGGIAALFTREFFALVRSRLTPGGVAVQWVHGYGLAPGDLRMIVRTFGTAFPDATLWGPNGGDYLLVGGAGLITLDPAAIGARVASAPGVRRDLEGIGFNSPDSLLADFLLREDDLARYAAGAGLNTDDLLPLEFSAPRSLYRDTAVENRRGVLAARRAEAPRFRGPEPDLGAAPVRHAMAAVLLRRRQYEEALPHLERALARDPGYLPARVDRGKVLLLLGRGAEGQADLEAALERDPGQAEAASTLGALYAGRGEARRAAFYYEQAVAAAPRHAGYRAGLAAAYLRMGEFDRAEAGYRAALTLAPGDPASLQGLNLAILRGRPADHRQTPQAGR